MMWISLLLCVATLATVSANSQAELDITEEVLRNYNSKLHPPTTKERPVVVTVNIEIVSISDVQLKTQTYDAEAIISQSWTDSRLNYQNTSVFPRPPHVILQGNQIDSIWTPDTAFLNAKHFHGGASGLRFYDDGYVRWQRTVFVALPCHARIQNFPFDVNRCAMYLTSDTRPRNEITYKWAETNPLIFSSEYDSQLLEYSIEKISQKEAKEAEWSQLQIEFFMQRRYGPVLVQVLVPSLLLVFLAWLAFWISPTELSSRVILGTISLVIILVLALHLNTFMPVFASYKAIDVFFAFCCLLVFLSLVETIIVNRIANRPRRILSYNHDEIRRLVRTVEEHEVYQKRKSRRIDRIFRILYPIAAILFTAIFILAYLRE